MGTDKLHIGDRDIDADMYEAESSVNGDASHNKWKLWLDPKNGIWVRIDHMNLAGNDHSPSSLVAKITDP
jgi:hypothetical protein